MKKLSRCLATMAVLSLTVHCGKENFYGNTREGNAVNPTNVVDDKASGPDAKPVDPRDNPNNPSVDPSLPSPGGPKNPDGTPVVYGNPNDPNNPNGSGGIDQFGGHSVEKIFTLTCDNAADGSRPVVDYSESKDLAVIAKVQGEFCPKSQRILNVMFIVDWSGSMGHHMRDDGQESQGNDPQVNGTCGRLQAAQQVLNTIKSQAKPTDQIFISMMPFAGGALTRRAIKTLPVAQFESQMTAQTFCSYVVQNSSYGYHPQNPGGVNGSAEGMVGVDVGYSATNYEAAFDASTSLLRGAGGRKVVYFVSDGQPTAGGSGRQSAEEASIAAAKQFRSQVDNLTFNALLLGHDASGAESLLQQVAGSPERVRLAQDASALSTEILQFPDSAEIREDSGVATVQVAPFTPKSLGLKYLKKDPTRDARWVFETQPFIMLGKPGVAVDNTVTVRAIGSDGSTHQSFITIKYNQK